MPRNIEIKAAVQDMLSLRERATTMATEEPVLLYQEDHFFEVPSGRLKLRIFHEGSGELIQYDRVDTVLAKESAYQLFPVTDPYRLLGVLAASLPVLVVVEKTRELIMCGQTRIHLDTVVGLGEFMELEVQLGETESSEWGEKIADQLMEELGITKQACVSGAYADMLLARR